MTDYRKTPYCTDNGVHIFVEDLIGAALEWDWQEIDWRREDVQRSRWRVPDSIIIRDWISGMTFKAIAENYNTSPITISKRIRNIFSRAECRAGLGARPLYEAIILPQRKTYHPEYSGSAYR